MILPTADRERIGSSVHYGRIGRSLHELGASTDVVDVAEAFDRVDHELVGTVADIVAVLLVGPPHVEMDVAFPAMVGAVCIGEFGKEWTWILGKRMEEGQVCEFCYHL